MTNIFSNIVLRSHQHDGILYPYIQIYGKYNLVETDPDIYPNNELLVNDFIYLERYAIEKSDTVRMALLTRVMNEQNILAYMTEYETFDSGDVDPGITDAFEIATEVRSMNFRIHMMNEFTYMGGVDLNPTGSGVLVEPYYYDVSSIFTGGPSYIIDDIAEVDTYRYIYRIVVSLNGTTYASNYVVGIADITIQEISTTDDTSLYRSSKDDIIFTGIHCPGGNLRYHGPPEFAKEKAYTRGNEINNEYISSIIDDIDTGVSSIISDIETIGFDLEQVL